MAEDTVAELERHVSECESCRLVLREKKRSLQAMLKVVGGDDIPVAAKPMLRVERPEKSQVDPEDVPVALRPADISSKPKLVRNWKPIILSGALAIVLGAMSFLGDPTRFFGTKVAPKGDLVSKTAIEKAVAPPLEAALLATDSAKSAPDDPLLDVERMPLGDSADRAVAQYVTRVASQEDTVAAPKATKVEPTPVPKSEPIVKPKPKLVQKPVRRRHVRSRQVAKKSAPKSTRGTIQVYDAAGSPIKVRR